MAKAGLIHDYDLHANLEPSAAGNTCAVCDKENTAYQWSDYSGEAMCQSCGAPYQLKWGTDEQQEEGAYPYLNLRPEFIPAAREYWAETNQFVCYGSMIGPKPGLADFFDWLDAHHPELAGS